MQSRTDDDIMTLEALAGPAMVLAPDTTCATAGEIFTSLPNLTSLVVSNGSGRLTLLPRDRFLVKMGTRYGWALFSDKSVTKVEVTAPLVLDRDTTLDQTARLASERAVAERYDDILVSGEEDLAVVTVTELLQALSSEQVRTQHALSDRDLWMRTIVSGAPLVLWANDTEGVFTLSEGKGLELLQLEPGQVVGTSLFDFYADSPDIIAAFHRALGGERVQTQVAVGDLVFDALVAPIHGADGIEGVIGVAVDVTERLHAESALFASQDELKHRAFHDPLTGLPNRALFADRVEHAMALSARTASSTRWRLVRAPRRARDGA